MLFLVANRFFFFLVFFSFFFFLKDLITDCSFVASLCIASAFERRIHKQLITSIIYPQVGTVVDMVRRIYLS